MLKHSLSFLIAFLLYSPSTLALTAYEESELFILWLRTHEAEFAACEPKKSGDFYILCDQTKIAKSELKSLFAMNTSELVDFVQKKEINLEVFCKEKKKGPFQKWCQKEITRQYFKNVSELHGQYIPDEKTIALFSTAYNGSLIHEYIHYLQTENTNPVFDKVYKKERNQVQKKIMTSFDEINAKTVQHLKANGKAKVDAEMMKMITDASNFTYQMLKFGYYQRLIDERGIFRLYILFGSEFGAKPEDIQLAKKNMGYLCKEKEMGPILPKEDCLAKNIVVDP